MSIRIFLLRLLAAALLPVLGVAGYLAAARIESVRAEQIEAARRLSDNLAMTLDRDLKGKISALQALSMLPFLDDPVDPAAFHRRALDFSGEFGGAVVLLDGDGQQIANTRSPIGAQLPKTKNMEPLLATFEARRPVVSEVLVGTVAKRPLIAIYVPVMRDGEVRYVLGQTWEPSAFQALLDTTAKVEQWRTGIIDGNGTFIARSHGAEQFVGRPAAPLLVAAAGQAQSGQVDNPSVEGAVFTNFFRHSELSNWYVAVGVPHELLKAPVYGTVVLLVIVALGASLMTGSILYFGGRKLTRGIARLTAVELSGPPTGLHELDRAHDTLLASNAAREQAREAAEKANESKSRFLAAASHDLRQPIQALRLFQGVLEAKLGGRPEAAVLAHMETALSSAERLLHGILDISKLDAGVLTLTPEPVAMSELFAALQTGWDGEVRFVSSSRIIMIDRVSITRILGNLISNAVKYGGGRVVVGCCRSAGGLRIEVVDNGRGIPLAEAGNVFEEFYQIGNPERSNLGGHGLGLAIARKLAERCGCTLGFRNRRQGCVFELGVSDELVVAAEAAKTAASGPPLSVAD